MTANSTISYIGVFLLFSGGLLSLIAGILYIRRASSPQWSNLTWWEKYIYPVVVLTVTVLIMDIGLIIAFAYRESSQVTIEDLITSSKVGTGFSGCMWIGFIYSYFVGIWTAHARASGLIPKIGIKTKK